MIEHQGLFPITRCANRSGQGLPGAQSEVPDEMMRYANVLREREKIKPGRTQHRRAIVRLAREAARPRHLTARNGMANEIDNQLMTRPAWMWLQLEAGK